MPLRLRPSYASALLTNLCSKTSYPLFQNRAHCTPNSWLAMALKQMYKNGKKINLKTSNLNIKKYVTVHFYACSLWNDPTVFSRAYPQVN